MNEWEEDGKGGLENIAVVQAEKMVAGIKVVRMEMEKVDRFEGCLS